MGFAVASLAAACDASSGSDDGSTDPGWFEIGWGDETFEPLPDGGTLRFMWGTQGAAMFPMPLRGGNFELPDPPANYLDDKAPILSLELDIEGYNIASGGHFKRIANYPVAFDVLEDGTYEFIYVVIIVPDSIDPSELHGRPARLHVELQPYDRPALVEERSSLTVAVDDRG